MRSLSKSKFFVCTEANDIPYFLRDALEFAVEKLEPFDKEKRAYWIKRLIEGLRKENCECLKFSIFQ